METRTILWPSGRFISPGPLTFQIKVERTIERWFNGECWQEIEEEVVSFDMEVAVPRPGCRPFFWQDDFGDFEESDHSGFIVVRDDDSDFWAPFAAKQEWLADIERRNRAKIAELAEQHGWSLDSDGLPLPPVRQFSIATLEAAGKKLMAHVVVEMGIFKSVGEAKRNGWDKPLEPGEFCLTKKKVRFKITD